MRMTLIAAVGKNLELGKDNQLVWHLPDDTAHYKRSIQGKTIVMGRKTAESEDMYFSDHRNILISRQAGYQREGFEVFPDLEAVLESCKYESEIMVTGGEQIYRLALPLADTLLITEIDGEFEADSFFPEYRNNPSWQQLEKVFHPDDAQHAHAFTICRYVKQQP